MKTRIICLIILFFVSVLLNACGSTIRNVEVTRIVPETVVVTQISTQIVKVPITTTPQTTKEVPPTPKWTPSYTETPVQIITMTPGLEVVIEKARPNVELFVSKNYIKDFLVMNYGVTSFGGKVFCGYQPIGIGNDGKNIKLFLWITCEEYFLNEKGLNIGTGIDIPVVLFVEVRNNRYKIVNTLDAGGGYRYLNVNFPPEIQKIITNLETDPETFTKGITNETQELRQDAKTFFGQ